MNSLTKVIAGVLGLSGFGIAVLAGLFAGNEGGTVLLRGVIAMAICYLVGVVVGAIGERTVRDFFESRRVFAGTSSESAGDNSTRTVEKSAGVNSAGGT